MEFEGGLTAAFTMVAFTEEICQRKTTIYGSRVGPWLGFKSSSLLIDKQSMPLLIFTRDKHTLILILPYRGSSTTVAMI